MYREWIKERLVNRTDFYRLWQKTKSGWQYLEERKLTDDVLATAAAGESVVALFSYGPDGSKWICLDIDRHQIDTSAIAEFEQADDIIIGSNFRIDDKEKLAFDLLDKCKDYQPMLERTGRGFHFWIFFTQPIPTDVAVALATKLGGDIERMPRAKDAFPNYNGSCVAIPGKHRLTNAPSAIWFDGKWIEFGSDGFDAAITSWQGIDSKSVGIKTKSRGLGDTVAKITKAVGIKPCGGCKKRQEKLNQLVPYSSAV